MPTMTPPNAFTLLDDDGDPVNDEMTYTTVDEARDALLALTRRPGLRHPQIVACWAYVSAYDATTTRPGRLLPRPTVPAHYGPGCSAHGQVVA